jgi:molecular chaperone HscB
VGAARACSSSARGVLVVICWSCQREAGSGPTCGSCKAPQPPDDNLDYFAVLGVPPRYSVDLGAAEGAFKQLSRQVHPDRFATADPRARRASLARTVQLNEAWRTIKDPLLRAEYMLRRAGVDVGDGGKGGDDDGDATVEVAPPPAFLMEILELHEELQNARRERDEVKVALMTGEMRERLSACMTDIAGGIEAGTPDGLADAGKALVALRYYRRFLDEADQIEQRTLASGRPDHG